MEVNLRIAKLELLAISAATLTNVYLAVACVIAVLINWQFKPSIRNFAISTLLLSPAWIVIYALAQLADGADGFIEDLCNGLAWFVSIGYAFGTSAVAMAISWCIRKWK